MSHYPRPFDTILLNAQTSPIGQSEVSKLPNIPFHTETVTTNSSNIPVEHIPVKGSQVQPPQTTPMQPSMPFVPMQPALPIVPIQPTTPQAPMQPAVPQTPVQPTIPQPPAILMPAPQTTPNQSVAPLLPTTPPLSNQPNITFAPIKPTTPTQISPVAPTPPSSLLPEILPDSPVFTVPSNPLLPPGYQEHLTYNSVQYLNGFLRTQIGKVVEVEFLIGENNLTTRSGTLLGIGINYILLQDLRTGDITACDFNNIKFIRFFTKGTNLTSIPL